MNKENEFAENALRHMGFQMRVAEKKHRKEFDNLERKCSHRKPHPYDRRNRYICSKMQCTWNLWECRMPNCPLLKGEL